MATVAVPAVIVLPYLVIFVVVVVVVDRLCDVIKS